jgi:hypothetical protein
MAIKTVIVALGISSCILSNLAAAQDNQGVESQPNLGSLKTKRLFRRTFPLALLHLTTPLVHLRM